MNRRLVLKSIAALTLALGLSACTQESAPSNVSSHESDMMRPTVDEHGDLHFASADAFFGTIDFLSKLSPQELNAWEDEIGFFSARRLFDVTMDQVTKVSEDEADAILNDHADVIEVSEDEARPRIRAYAYTTVTDRDGIFYVGGVVHKVFPDAVVSSEDGSVETIDATVASLGALGWAHLGSMTEPAEGVRIVRHSTGMEHLSAVLTGCYDKRTAWYETSDRKVDFEISTYTVTCSQCCGQYYNQDKVTWSFRGYKKNWLKNWVPYETYYWYQNVAFELKVPEVTGYDGVKSIFSYKPYSFSFPYGESYSDYSLFTVTVDVGNQVQNAPVDAPYFDKVMGQGKSRGTGTNGWANICCGYSGGCGF
jgi:hypothetical protein